MKRKLILLISIMLGMILVSFFMLFFVKQQDEKNQKITIVTSFYPMYVLALNITDNIPDVEVVNLTAPTTGCLHDYQLTTTDMKKLEGADVLILNGGGMESFTDNIIEAYPKLPIITASNGIEYLKSEEHVHENTTDDKSPSVKPVEEEYNAHVWLNMNDYLQQIKTIQEALSKYDPENASAYQDNADAYQEKIKALKVELESNIKGVENTKIIIFHDSFAYLAQELGLEVVHAVDMDSESSLSAGEIAEIVDEVKKEKVKILFTEKQFSTSIADNIAKETGASVYVLDSIVNGAMNKDGYLEAMKRNLEVLKEALNN